MGATRLASEKDAATYFAEFVFTFLYSRRETRLLKKCPFSKFGLHFANN